MAQNRTDNFNIAAPKSIDNRYLKNGVTVYASTAEAHSLMLYKHIGLTCLILENGEPVEYHYKSATTTVGDLVRKITYNTMTIAQLRSSNGLSPSTVVTTTDFGGGTWTYLGIDDNIYEDNSGTIIITADSKVWKRVYSGNASATWFGIKPDNTAAANTLALQLAIDSMSLTGGGVIDIPCGEFLSNKLTIKNKVILNGQGNSHSSVYFVGSAPKVGTLLLIDGQAGDDCIVFQGNTSFSGLKNMSIYNNNSTAIRAVVNIPGVLYPVMENIELSSRLHGANTVGLLLSASTTSPNWETLYGVYNNVSVITNAAVGVHTALKLLGLSPVLRPNASRFVGGHFQGYSLSLLIDGAQANSAPQGISFLGTTFESYYNVAQEVIFVPNSIGMNAFETGVDRYAITWIHLKQANQVSFTGCYFEDGNSVFTYDDGTNGVHPSFPMIVIDTGVSQTTFIGDTIVAGILDRGFGTVHPNKLSFLDQNAYATVEGQAVGVTSQIAIGSNGVTGLRVREGNVLVGENNNTDTGEDLQVTGVAKIAEIKNIFSAQDAQLVKTGGAKYILGDQNNTVSMGVTPVGLGSNMILSVENNEVARLKADEFIVQEKFTAGSTGSFVGTVSGADAELPSDFVTLGQLSTSGTSTYFSDEEFTI